jgi:hypothetical protein
MKRRGFHGGYRSSACIQLGGNDHARHRSSYHSHRARSEALKEAMMIDTTLRALKIRHATAAEYAAWDRATERRADAEYALEQFKERQDLSEEEKQEFEERYQRMQVAIDVAVQEEKAAEQIWREALERAERETARD